MNWNFDPLFEKKNFYNPLEISLNLFHIARLTLQTKKIISKRKKNNMRDEMKKKIKIYKIPSPIFLK